MATCAVVTTPLSPSPLSGDRELLERAQRRDSEAFAELVRRHYFPCLRMAMSILRNSADAEDEVQNTFLKALVHLPEFENRAELRTWLISIVRNQCLMRVRSAGYRRSSSLEATASSALSKHSRTRSTVEQDLSDEQVRTIVVQNVRRLPVIYREVLLLHGLGEMRLESIANRLGISPGAVKSRLRRARVELKNRLGERLRGSVH